MAINYQTVTQPGAVGVLHAAKHSQSMKPFEVKLCCLIGHMTTMSVASLSISLPSGENPEVIQKYLIPIYEVGNQWS